MSFSISSNFKPYVIPKTSFGLLMYYSGIGNQIWEPFTSQNAGVFYEKIFHFSRIVGKLSRLTLDNGSFIETHFFSSKKVLKDTLHRNFVQHPDYSLTEVIPTLLDLNREIAAQTKLTGILEPNRKGTYVFLDLEEKQIKELTSSKSLEASFIHLLETAADNRLYIFVFARKARYLPPAIHRSLSWAAYLEEDNIQFAQDFYKVGEEIFNEKRRIIGTLKRADTELLIPIHETIFEPSDYKYLSDKHMEIEDEAYKRFLNSL